MLQDRLFSYGDTIVTGSAPTTCICRLIGPRWLKLVTTAAMARCARIGNYAREKNYEPNSFGGPQQSGEPLWAPIEVAGLTGNHALEHHRDDNDFVQAGDLYRLMSEAQKQRLIANLTASLSQVSRGDIIERSVGHFRKADPQ